jgi:hypothetical protein
MTGFPKRRVLVAALLGAACWALPTRAKDANPPAPVDPATVERVQAMSRHLAAAKAFTVHAEIAWDEVMHSGRKLQFAAALDASVRRPDGLAVAYLSDLGGKKLWYDGKSVTILDLLHDAYATTPAPGTTSQMLAELEAKQGASFPLADFLADDPAKRLLGDLRSAFVVGPGDVDGTTCQHLAFSTSALDWQLWIEEGERPVPRKVVITYRGRASSPQFGAVLSDWKIVDALPAAAFAAELPKDAHRVDFVAARNAPEEER